MKSYLISAIVAIIIVTIGVSKSNAWMVDCNDGTFTSNTGESATNSFYASISDNGYSGKCANLTLNGARLTYANSFNGNDIISLDKGTIELNFKPTVTSNSFPRLFDTTNENIAIYTAGAASPHAVTIKMKQSNGTSISFSSTTKLVNDTWYDIKLDYDLSLASNNVKLYINGIEDGHGTVTTATLAGTGTSFFWGIMAYGGQSWNGYYDNLQINQVIPEPATLGLLAMGALGALLRRKR